MRTLAAAILMLVPACMAEAKDPLESVMWETVREYLFEGQTVIFDDRVTVSTAGVVENNMVVPIQVSAEALGKDLGRIEEIVVFADHNPIPAVARYRPIAAKPVLELRLKVQEATPIRAAARTADGIWHVGGLRVDAAGGGCTVASAGQANKLWESHLNEVQGKVWSRPDGSDRVRLRIIHPMDTGLVAAIPAFFIETLTISDDKGAPLAELTTYEPVSENPVFSFDLHANGAPAYVIAGRDNEGNEIAARLEAGQ